jgi:hypothetical protein
VESDQGDTAPTSGSAIYVIATNDAATRRAFETAARQATAGRARVVIVVPHPVPFGADRCGCDLTRIAERYCELARGGSCPTTVLVCVCRDACDVSRMIPENPSVPSLVVVAGRRSHEQRLLRALEREGRAVEFIDLDAARARASVSGTF